MRTDVEQVLGGGEVGAGGDRDQRGDRGDGGERLGVDDLGQRVAVEAGRVALATHEDLVADHRDPTGVDRAAHAALRSAQVDGVDELARGLVDQGERRAELVTVVALQEQLGLGGVGQALRDPAVVLVPGEHHRGRDVRDQRAQPAATTAQPGFGAVDAALDPLLLPLRGHLGVDHEQKIYPLRGRSAVASGCESDICPPGGTVG